MDYTIDNTVDLARQLVRNDIPKEYTMSEAQEAMRQALIQANGGSDKINPRTFRNTDAYTIIEKTLDIIREETFKEDDLWNSLVETMVVDIGDRNEFVIEDDSLFIVSEIGRGTQSVRRQRFQNSTSVQIPVRSHAIKCFEHWDRILAGRVDFNSFIQNVDRSYVQYNYEQIYKLFASIDASTDGMYGAVYQSGTYDEDTILNIIDHIEADTGSKAMIIGSRPALRHLKPHIDVISTGAKDDMYNMGYYGKFNGTDTVLVRQRNIAGTHDFLFPQDRIYIIAGDEKPIKRVEEGDTLLISRDAELNSDLTQEYFVSRRFGTGLIMRHAIGCFVFTK